MNGPMVTPAERERAMKNWNQGRRLGRVQWDSGVKFCNAVYKLIRTGLSGGGAAMGNVRTWEPEATRGG